MNKSLKIAAMLGTLLSSSIALADEPAVAAGSEKPTTRSITKRIEVRNVVTGDKLQLAQEALKVSRAAMPGRQFVYFNAKPTMEKGPFLGVSSSSVPAALREQLSLQKGLGLVVDSVEKDSPADKAGLKQYDVLQKLNDQILINAPQFQVLIRTMKPGDTIKLEIMRKGQPVSLSATLIEHDIPELTDNGISGNSFNQSFMTVDGNVGIDTTPAMISVDAMGGGNSKANWIWKTNDRTLEITNTDGKRHLTVKDKDKTTFDGPIDTDAQHEALPADVKEALKTMEEKFDTVEVNVKGIPSPDAPPATPATPER